MILDRVDYGNLVSAFRLRGSYSKCSNNPIVVQQKGPDASSKEQAMIERAKQRRQLDVQQAKLKLAKKEARSRIQQFEDQRRKQQQQDFEQQISTTTSDPTNNKRFENSDVDSGIYMIESPKEDVSRAELVSRIVSKWRAQTRWTKVIRHARSKSSNASNVMTPEKASSSRKQNDGALLSPNASPRPRASSTGSTSSWNCANRYLL